MDSHIQGPRGGNAYGANVSANGVAGAFAETAKTVEICRTLGASPTTPIMARITGKINTVFDGAAPVFSLSSTKLDGSDTVAHVEEADFSTTDPFELTLFLTEDRIFSFIFDVDDGTEGDGIYFLELIGCGKLQVNI